MPQQLTAIIKTDHIRSGLFKIIETGNTMSETAINFGAAQMRWSWATLGR